LRPRKILIPLGIFFTIINFILFQLSIYITCRSVPGNLTGGATGGSSQITPTKQTERRISISTQSYKTSTLSGSLSVKEREETTSSNE